MERFSFVFLIAGLLFFGLAFAVSGWVPMLPVQHLEVRTVEQMAAQPPLAFLELKDEYPQALRRRVRHGERFRGLRRGAAAGPQDLHRRGLLALPQPAESGRGASDEARFGRKSFPEEHHNELNMPPLVGHPADRPPT